MTVRRIILMRVIAACGYLIICHPHHHRCCCTAKRSSSCPFFAIVRKNATQQRRSATKNEIIRREGWVETNGEWNWKEEDEEYSDNHRSVASSIVVEKRGAFFPTTATATPILPAGKFRPKQSLGQNYLRDGNTVAKIVRAFLKDCHVQQRQRQEEEGSSGILRPVELGPGAGALTDTLLPLFPNLLCIEIDARSVELLSTKHADTAIRVRHMDVLQVDYMALASQEGGPLRIIGNLPYYITTQILFALADASHSGSVTSATVTMQWEVAQRLVAHTSCKEYGILSVVFQLYADCHIHFKIPPTVFYPQPKVYSALVGLHFVGPTVLKRRLAGVRPEDLRRIVTTSFQQRRKTLKNSLKRFITMDICHGDKERANELFHSKPYQKLPSIGAMEAKQKNLGDDDTFANDQELMMDWANRRPEELSPGQFVELTRLLITNTNNNNNTIVAPQEYLDQESKGGDCHYLKKKVWRKLNHGANT